MDKDTISKEGHPSVHRELGIVLTEYKMHSIKWRGDLYDINYDSYIEIGDKKIKYSKLLQLIIDNGFIITNNYVMDSHNFKSSIYIDTIKAVQETKYPLHLSVFEKSEAVRQKAIQLAACKHKRFKDLITKN